MRVRRILDDADHTGAVARRRTFFQLGKFLNWQIGSDKTFEGVKTHTKGDGQFSFCQCIS